jgi:hypothetical protein
LLILAAVLANVACGPMASGQEANARYLAGLREIQRDYCFELWYPRSRQLPDDEFRWDHNDAKQARIARLDQGGVDRELLALVQEAKTLSDEVSETNRTYLEELREAGKTLRKKLPHLLDDPPELPDLIIPLLPGVAAEVQLHALQRRCRTEEPDFHRRWKLKLAALAMSQPALKPFAADPDSCSPLSAFGVPQVQWHEQEIGAKPASPYRLGELREPIEFEVEPNVDHNWCFYYRFSLPATSSRLEHVTVQLASTQGYVHGCLQRQVKERLDTANQRANAGAGKPDLMQFPLQPGESYLLTVYHIHKPAFGPQWSSTRVRVRMWRGDTTQPPGAITKRVVNVEQQRRWLEQQRLSEAAAHQRLQDLVLTTFAARPAFSGRYSEAGNVHPLTLRVLQYLPDSQAISGEIDWPSYGGSTRFRGQLVKTNQGLEVTFKETDFVPGKASSQLVLGGEYRLRPELKDDQLVLRGDFRLPQRVHPLILSTAAVESAPAATATVQNAGEPAAPASASARAARPATESPPSLPAAASGESIVQAVTRPASALTHQPGEIAVFSGATAYDGPLGLLFSKDGKTVLATGYHVRAWDLDRRVQVLDFDQNSSFAARPSQGTKTVFVGSVGSASQAVFQFPLSRQAQPPTHLDEIERITALAVSSDGRVAAVSREPGVLAFFDLVKNRRVMELPISFNATALAFAAASQIVSGDSQEGLRVWDLRGGGRLLGRFDGHGQGAAIKLAAVSEDGRTIASASGPAGEPGPLTLIFWDKESLQEKHSVSVGQRGTSISLSPDWRFALVGEQSGEVGLYSTSSGECLESLRGHTKPVSAVTFSPCWRFALTAASDDTVRLWGLRETK